MARQRPTKIDRLEALTGLALRGMFIVDRDVLEDTIDAAAAGAELSSEPDVINAYEQVVEIATDIWEFRFKR